MPSMYTLYRYKVKFSILNIAGNKRYTKEDEVVAPSEKAVREKIHKFWRNSKGRVIKVTRLSDKPLHLL